MAFAAFDRARRVYRLALTLDIPAFGHYNDDTSYVPSKKRSTRRGPEERAVHRLQDRLGMRTQKVASEGCGVKKSNLARVCPIQL